MAGFPINLNLNNDKGRPLSFGEVDKNFELTQKSINNFQVVDYLNIANDYTLTYPDDCGKLILVDTNIKAVNITVDTTANQPFDDGFHIDIVQYGTNPVTIVGDPAVTINSFNNKNILAGKYVGVTLIKVNGDEWLLIGNLV